FGTGRLGDRQGSTRSDHFGPARSRKAPGGSGLAARGTRALPGDLEEVIEEREEGGPERQIAFVGGRRQRERQHEPALLLARMEERGAVLEAASHLGARQVGAFE